MAIKPNTGAEIASDFPAKAKALFDIAYSRSISDMKWVAVGTVEAARLSLEEGLREYIDENLTIK